VNILLRRSDKQARLALLRRGNAQRFLNATPDCPNLIVVVPSFCQSTSHLLVALSTGRVSA
jgi:hypothetical protein